MTGSACPPARERAFAHPTAGNPPEAMNSALSFNVHKRADSLVAAFARAGYTRVSPAILQPAEPFFDLSGENMRRHMNLVTGTAGRAFRLGPAVTIPVERHDPAPATDPDQ